MNSALLKILMWIVAFDVFFFGLLLIFLINARINLKRRIMEQRFFVKACLLAGNVKTSEEAAAQLHISPDEFRRYCRAKGIEAPEDREARLEEERRKKEEEQQRILEEEAAWRAEQERILEERRKAQEEEARKRKERLRRFGFR